MQQFEKIEDNGFVPDFADLNVDLLHFSHQCQTGGLAPRIQFDLERLKLTEGVVSENGI